jgi:hypothetical protein
MVFLDETDNNPVLAQHRIPKDLGEETALVVMAYRPDFLHIGYHGRNDLHAGASGSPDDLSARKL